MEKCIEKRKLISEYINQIDQRIMMNMIKEVGKERLVTQNIEEIWKDYSFILKGVLYRWDNCNVLIKRLIEYLDKLEAKNGCFIPLRTDIADELSYEFENLIVAFPRLDEEPLNIEVRRHLSKKNASEYEKHRISKKDADGLFWEINLLRNRAAHSTPGYYTVHEGYAARYMSITSRIRPVRVVDGKYIFDTSLLSYRNNKKIREIVNDVIIEKKFGEEYAKTPLLDILFESTTPKGHGKKNPQILFMNNVAFFDLNSEFYELSNDMMDYIIKQVVILKHEIIGENEANGPYV